MSTPRVKLQKRQIVIPGHDEFTQMAGFSQKGPSLYQSLSVGLIEIMIRFKLSPNYIKPLNYHFNRLVQSGSQEISAAIAFAREYDVEAYFNIFLQILTNICDGAPNILTSFAWLKHYSESENEKANYGLDIGMRVILGAMFVGYQEMKNDIMSDRYVDEFILMNQFAREMNIQINVHEGIQKSVYVNQTPHDYPVISLVKGDFGYALLYTNESLRIEQDPGFTKADLERLPFISIWDKRPKLNPIPVFPTIIRVNKNVCNVCKDRKDPDEFTAIVCASQCQICYACRVQNSTECYICGRYYSNYEKELIEILKISI